MLNSPCIYIHCAFADPILLRKCLCRPHPSQELPLQTVSFAGIVFTDHILYIQELSFQSLAVRGIVLRNHNIFKKTCVHFFSKQHYDHICQHTALLKFLSQPCGLSNLFDNFLKLMITFPKYLCSVC